MDLGTDLVEFTNFT